MCVAACILYFASSAEAVSYSQNDIGTTGISGTYNLSGQTYTVGGGGTGVLAGSDNFSFVSTTATGNVEFVGKVTSQTNTGAYAVAGLMVRDSATSATAQTAYISVSPLNGVNFTSRLTDGTTATRTLGSSVASPIWLRMVVTGSSVAGYESSDGINWVLTGVSQITLPSTFYVGFAVASSVSGTLSTAAFQSVTYATNVPQRSANLLTWLRADDNVAYNGSNQIISWQDQSSNGFNASAATVAGTLVQNVAGYIPGISFNGTSDFLSIPSGYSNFSSGSSIFIVVKPTSTTASSQILNLGTGSSDAYNMGMNLDTSSHARYFVYNSTGSTLTGVSFGSTITTSAQLLEAVQSGTSATIWTNALSPVTNASMNAIPTPLNRTNNYLGQASGGGNYFNGAICEVLIFDTALSTAERQSLETYFMSRYGL